MTHIGKKIEQVFKKSGMTKTAFAERINKGRENIYDIFKRESIDTDLLLSISKVLNYNFFMEFIEKKDELNEPAGLYNKSNKTKVLIELELDNDDILKLGLRDKVIKALNK